MKEEEEAEYFDLARGRGSGMYGGGFDGRAVSQVLSDGCE